MADEGGEVPVAHHLPISQHDVPATSKPAHSHRGGLLLASQLLPPLCIATAQLVEDLVLPLLGDSRVLRILHILQVGRGVAFERLVDLLKPLTNLTPGSVTPQLLSNSDPVSDTMLPDEL